ncbi:hypothetical protein Pyn_20730 [Prunus yedoensis var. nudiflora]|uniref:Uncharacterized protein n=1 Tax=Prunus yedoensis var. nudiflora TaxID=2094558 RepID=A0A314UV60_PRUYE|nr:hypothetical protein Pyn_20730 [Prunus yedoensis var. nudiflora]
MVCTELISPVEILPPAPPTARRNQFQGDGRTELSNGDVGQRAVNQVPENNRLERWTGGSRLEAHLITQPVTFFKPVTNSQLLPADPEDNSAATRVSSSEALISHAPPSMVCSVSSEVMDGDLFSPIIERQKGKRQRADAEPSQRESPKLRCLGLRWEAL